MTKGIRVKQNIAPMKDNSNTERKSKEGGAMLTSQFEPLPGIGQGEPQLTRTLISLEYRFILLFHYLARSFDLARQS